MKYLVMILVVFMMSCGDSAEQIAEECFQNIKTQVMDNKDYQKYKNDYVIKNSIYNKIYKDAIGFIVNRYPDFAKSKENLYKFNALLETKLNNEFGKEWKTDKEQYKKHKDFEEMLQGTWQKKSFDKILDNLTWTYNNGNLFIFEKHNTKVKETYTYQIKDSILVWLLNDDTSEWHIDRITPDDLILSCKNDKNKAYYEKIIYK